MITAESLPLSFASPAYSGARALPLKSGQGVYLQFYEFIFYFTCDANSCQWHILEHQLINWVRLSVMMYLPTEYNCTTTSITKGNTISSKDYKFKVKSSYNNHIFPSIVILSEKVLCESDLRDSISKKL